MMNVGGHVEPFFQIFLGGVMQTPKETMFRSSKLDAHGHTRWGWVKVEGSHITVMGSYLIILIRSRAKGKFTKFLIYFF